MSTISPYAIDHLKVVPRRYYGRWLSAALILLALGFVVHAFAHGQIEWAVVAKFMTAKVILQGLLNTILMTIYAMVVGIVLGVVFAVMVMSPNKLLKAVATFYIWFFRGTPLLLQMLLWFNLALVFPTMGIPGWFEARTVDIITPFVASLLGLGIGQGAYTAGWCARHPGGGQRPDRGRQGHRHDAPDLLAPHRAAAGHAGDHPAGGQ
jgi:polar amino acid transport system permease protein